MSLSTSLLDPTAKCVERPYGEFGLGEHHMLITLVSASLLGLLLVYLSIGVTNARGRAAKVTDDSEEEALHAAIRAHGNLTEYAPIGLILIGLLEYTAAHQYLVLGIAVIFVAARFMHGLTFGKFEGRNPFRFWGTVLTFLALLIASLAGLVQAFLFL